MSLKVTKQKLIIICDSFYPETTSAAVQLNDLCDALCQFPIEITVICPSDKIEQNHEIEKTCHNSILRIKSLRLKDKNRIVRALLEIWSPLKTIFIIKFNPNLIDNCDGVVFYSPSIFHGPLVHYIKIKYKCKSFLIVRDIFPEWAVDLDILKKRLPYFFFKAIQKYQYCVADHIGIQSQGNRLFFNKSSNQTKTKILFLRNWLKEDFEKIEPDRSLKSFLQSKKIFVYCGNIGVAQNLKPLFGSIERLKRWSEIHFLIIGEGTQKCELKELAENNDLTNVSFMNTVSEAQLMGILRYCDFGSVILDKSHKTHNIPGKYLTYLRSNLPVLALVNAGNDIIEEIHTHSVGLAIENSNSACIENTILKLAKLEESFVDKMRQNCELLFKEKYRSQTAAEIIFRKLFSPV